MVLSVDIMTCVLRISTTRKIPQLCTWLCSNQYHRKVDCSPRFKYPLDKDRQNNGKGKFEAESQLIHQDSSEDFGVTRCDSEQGTIKSTAGVLSGDLMEIDNLNLPFTMRKVSVTNDDRKEYKKKGFYIRKPSVPISGEILFGIHPVLLALQAKRRKFHKLLLKEIRSKSEPNLRLEEIKKLANDVQVPIVYVPKPTLNSLCENRPHQSVCLDASKLETTFYESTISDQLKTNSPIWLFLHQIYDPMNLGAVLRSAYFLGVEKVFGVENFSCPLSPVVSKASSGAMELLEFFKVRDVEEFLQRKINDDWEVLGTTTGKTSKNDSKTVPIDVAEYKLTKPTIVVVGNECDGLNANILRLCTNHVTISPAIQMGEEISSLNVSVATGIILHSLVKSRKNISDL